MHLKRKLAKSEQAEGMINKVVAIAVALILIASLVPLGLVQISGANLSGVDPSVATIFTIALPVVAVIAILVWFLRD